MARESPLFCYWCGESFPDSRDHVPGKLFGIVGDAHGIIVPAHESCNKEWQKDQEFFRLRLALHAGSSPAFAYGKQRELARLRKPAGRQRYITETSKVFMVEGREHYGLTPEDCGRIKNVVIHWAAAIHYARRNCLAAVPGEYCDTLAKPRLSVSKLTNRLSPEPTGVWRTNDGELVRWWFSPHSCSAHKSAVIFNILRLDTLWFFVRF